MAATMAEKAWGGNTWPSSAISASPEPMPISAVAYCSSIASSQPNAISSTTAARPMPTSFRVPPYGVGEVLDVALLRLNVTLSPARLATCISAAASASLMRGVDTSNRTVA